MKGQISKIGNRYLVEILAEDKKEFDQLKKFKNKNIPKSENFIYMGDIEIAGEGGSGVKIWLGKKMEVKK